MTGREFRTQSVPIVAGMNRWRWDLCSTPVQAAQGGGRGAGGGGGGFGGGGGCAGGRIAPVGVYRVAINIGGTDLTPQLVNVVEDVWLNEK